MDIYYSWCASLKVKSYGYIRLFDVNKSYGYILFLVCAYSWCASFSREYIHMTSPTHIQHSYVRLFGIHTTTIFVTRFSIWVSHIENLYVRLLAVYISVWLLLLLHSILTYVVLTCTYRRSYMGIIGLFCKRALQKRRYSAKETYDFKEPTNRSRSIHTHMTSTIERLRIVGSLKSYVSFAEYRLFYRALLQKRPMILRSLLIVAAPYSHIQSILRYIFLTCKYPYDLFM